MRLFIIVLLVSSIFVCSNKIDKQILLTNSKTDMLKAKVELNIFSGRENPKWELSAKQTAELLTVLKKLSPVEEKPVFPDGLGYRGFEVLISDSENKQTHQILTFKGKVSVNSENAEKFFLDKEKQLENYLLDSGEETLSRELKETVRKEID